MTTLPRTGRPLLAPYITGGIRPDWTEYLHEYVRNGADAIEIGLPFSDPILDGPTIQEASDTALRRGVTVRSILDEVAAIDAGVPLIAMTYYNLVHRDAAAFCRDLAAAGIHGLIVPDLPVDESAPLAAAAASAEVDLTLLVAPTTPAARLAEIAAASRGFVYAVSTMGTTGSSFAASGGRLATEVRELTALPVLLAFGIATHADAVTAARSADGVVIGAALMRRILDGCSPAELGAVLAGFRKALDEDGSDCVP
ncbi:tryptophan synthase alpha chain [Actinoplanes philippinensis]|uniref:Tryptophan synthase alpha chain n=1 Tax=Actinoplanes philippinensis TaxID=35752 RepID=A0A1I2K3T2_9ACTN|nr:tryptophan synthase subunit alpha [Actinoplanes philippinensis]GIE81181.1 tryptophan synthase alpha chain [Actinoplanes philippinensis]SFF59576.1 tryptophan synthase, alpha chain [Actinoplanes philippinensis]